MDLGNEPLEVDRRAHGLGLTRARRSVAPAPKIVGRRYLAQGLTISPPPMAGGDGLAGPFDVADCPPGERTRAGRLPPALATRTRLILTFFSEPSSETSWFLYPSRRTSTVTFWPTGTSMVIG